MSKIKSTNWCICLMIVTLLGVKLSKALDDPEPIVIQTPVKNYDTPTLDEYQKCFEHSFICKQNCEIAANRSTCEAECPVCPILIKQNILVQGVNDSSYQPPMSNSVNTTNIIRLTNQIHNVIEQSPSNITARNENNVHVHASSTESFGNFHNNTPEEDSFNQGGEFGLGANINGSCCIVIRPSKNCDLRRSSGTVLCHTKRRLVCGTNCKARVMYAKSVLNCEMESDGNETCARHMEYVPYEERKIKQQTPKCYFVPRWPYVSCVRERPTASICRRCLQLPYGYVLIKGLPPACIHCLSESPYFTSPWQSQTNAAFELNKLSNADPENSINWQIPAFEKYFDETDADIFDDLNYVPEVQNVPRRQRSSRRAKRYQLKRSVVRSQVQN